MGVLSGLLARSIAAGSFYFFAEKLGEYYGSGVAPMLAVVICIIMFVRGWRCPQKYIWVRTMITVAVLAFGHHHFVTRGDETLVVCIVYIVLLAVWGGA